MALLGVIFPIYFCPVQAKFLSSWKLICIFNLIFSFTGYCSGRRTKCSTCTQGSLRYYLRIPVCSTAPLFTDSQYHLSWEEFHHHISSAYWSVSWIDTCQMSPITMLTMRTRVIGVLLGLFILRNSLVSRSMHVHLNTTSARIMTSFLDLNENEHLLKIFVDCTIIT